MKASTVKPNQATWPKVNLRGTKAPARTDLIALISVLCAIGFGGTTRGAESSLAFGGEKTTWHGFDRYDFVMNDANLAITPIKAAEDEKEGIRHTSDGQRRCIVVVPKAAAVGSLGVRRRLGAKR